MSTAWRVFALSFSYSSIDRFRRISACFWLAMTLAACSFRRRCCSCASEIACSSWTDGSAFSLKVFSVLATRYFHQRFMAFHMGRHLSAASAELVRRVSGCRDASPAPQHEPADLVDLAHLQHDQEPDVGGGPDRCAQDHRGP